MINTYVVTPEAGHFATYDATNPREKRRSLSTTLASEDYVLRRSRRNAMIGGVRDLHRNFTLARWMVNHHLDNVATFSFQSTTGNDDVDQRIEDLMTWYARPANCDVTGRHSLQRMIRLAEERRLIDGDMFLMKIQNGRLQAIEADRIREVEGTNNEIQAENNLREVHGVRLAGNGRPTAYALHNRVDNTANGYEFDRWVRSTNILHHGWFERFDQVRGISPFSAAYNSMQDLYESLDQTLLKIKVAAMFGLVFYREGSGDPATTEADGDGYSVDFGRGPVLLDLDPGDRAEFLENKTPATEFREFVGTLIELCLKALQIPMSAYDPSVTNYSGARQALLAYEQHCEFRRHEITTLLDNITAWRLNMFLRDGDLVLPAGLDLQSLKWEWRPRPMPWIDPLKETQAYAQQVELGIASRTDICKRHGRDIRDVTAQLHSEQEMRDGLYLDEVFMQMGMEEDGNDEE